MTTSISNLRVPDQSPQRKSDYKTDYRLLRNQLSERFSDQELKLLDRVFEFTERAHAGERRLSGEVYIRHPIAVAKILVNLKPDVSSIAAALLHDILENKPYNAQIIARDFGDDIANLVEGMTKLDRVKLKEQPWLPIPIIQRRAKERLGFERHVESLRKMLLAMTKDIRVIIVKLADRLDNMRTLAVFRPDKRRRIAEDTLEIYAPIAYRLGIGEWKGELQDLAFPYVYPEEHVTLEHRVGPLLKRQQATIRRARELINRELFENKIAAEVHGRVKHLYSLWRKLQHYGNALDRIYDLVALRIVVDNEEQCYHALGLVHKLWKPLFGRIKDYISLPKPNGYQSLHTTVFGPNGNIIEVQIRTKEMHLQAERGIASHWLYEGKKDRSKSVNRYRPTSLNSNELHWITEMRRWQESLQDVNELKPTLVTDFFSDRIFCFTPAGDVVDLPTGSTPIDFAYEIHTTIGNHCLGATADGRPQKLDSPLFNGQIVSIRTSNQQHPRRDWLSYVKTAKARSAIRAYLDGRKRGNI